MAEHRKAGGLNKRNKFLNQESSASLFNQEQSSETPTITDQRKPSSNTGDNDFNENKDATPPRQSFTPAEKDKNSSALSAGSYHNKFLGLMD